MAAMFFSSKSPFKSSGTTSASPLKPKESPFKTMLTRAQRKRFNLRLKSPIKVGAIKPLGGATKHRAEARKQSDGPTTVRKPLCMDHIKFDFGQPSPFDSPSQGAQKRKRERDDDADVAVRASKKTQFSIPVDLDATQPTVQQTPAFSPTISDDQALPLVIRSPPTSPSRNQQMKMEPGDRSPSVSKPPKPRAVSESASKHTQQQISLGIGLPGTSNLSPSPTSPRRWTLTETSNSTASIIPARETLASSSTSSSDLLSLQESICINATPRPFVNSLRSTDISADQPAPIEPISFNINLNVPSILTPRPRSPNSTYIGSAAPLNAHFDPNLPRIAFVQATPCNTTSTLRNEVWEEDEEYVPEASIDDSLTNATEETADTSQADSTISTDGMSTDQASQLLSFHRLVLQMSEHQPRRISTGSFPTEKSISSGQSASTNSKLPVRSASTSALSRTRSGQQPAPIEETKPRRASTGTRKSNVAQSQVDSQGNAMPSILSLPPQQQPLQGVTAFVDVRTQEGDDASAVFVDMLRGLGAKVTYRFSGALTHIIFKNGKPMTMNRYRSLKTPKPFLMGIAWIVKCKELQTRVAEKDFLVELPNPSCVSVSQKGMAPKAIHTSSNIGNANPCPLRQANAAILRRATRFHPRIASPLSKETPLEAAHVDDKTG